MEAPEISRVTPQLPSDLLLEYDDGSVRRFSCAPYLDRGIFGRLKEASLFIQAHVAHGAVCWPGGLDIAPETQFLRSVPESNREPVSN